MDKKLQYKNKGLSTVIATVLLIALVMATSTIVWVSTNKLIDSKTKGTQECFKIASSENVVLNEEYTCFNPTTDEVQFSLDIGDVEIDGVVISILVGGNSKVFTLTNTPQVISDIRPYKGIVGDAVKLPGKNEGKTYIASGFTESEVIQWIKIAPIIDDKQCDMTDEVYKVVDCNLLVN